MAEMNNVVDFFMKWEGGLSRDGRDRASRYPCPMLFNGYKDWHTNKGITYQTWVHYFGHDQKHRFLTMSIEDVKDIFRRGYWDKVKGDEIESDAIAATLVSWAWGSGSKTAIKLMQGVVGTKRDGIIGKKTLKAINDSDEKELFDLCLERREKFFRDICKARPTNNAFLRGWLRRLNNFNEEFKPQ